MKLNQLLAVLGILLSCSIYAQPQCGFDKQHKEKLRSDPSFKKSIEAETEKIRQFIRQKNSTLKPQPLAGTALYKIPVVVHVVHTGGAIGSIYNPTDAQIDGAIDYWNQNPL